MICTSIEQSQHLLKLGLDPNTADMYYTGHRCILHNPKEIEYTQEPRVRTKFVSFDRLEVFFPAWSLQALLEVMPSFIEHKGQKLRLTIEKAGVWNVFYIGTEHRLNEIWFNGEYGDPVEPAYEMVCWLLENNLINNN